MKTFISRRTGARKHLHSPAFFVFGYDPDQLQSVGRPEPSEPLRMPFASCGNCPYPAHGFQCYMTEGDCCVAEIDGDYPILKRLESFDPYELAQFQGAAVSCGYFSMGDLINLTFCCQEVTVVQDFTDLTAIGRKHYMDIHGGLTEAEQKTVDFRKTALSLLLTEEEKITPYGVVYNNGTLRNSSTCSTISPVSPPPWNTGGT